MKLLLLSPRGPDTFWSFRHVMSFVGKETAFPSLGLLPVAAMFPPEWELRVVGHHFRRVAAGLRGIQGLEIPAGADQIHLR